MSGRVTLLTSQMISLLIGASALSLLSVLPALSQSSTQTTTAQPLQDFRPQDNRDPFSGTGSGQTSGVMDLIHRATLGNMKSGEEFRAEQKENLNSAAAEFRALQLRRLQQMQSTPAAIPAPTPAPKP